jgi:hypothetical protein
MTPPRCPECDGPMQAIEYRVKGQVVSREWFCPNCERKNERTD